MKKIDTYFILNTGASMPAVGLGTWKFPLDKAEKAVFCALSECGYRHIDCAAIYRNEKEIGQSLKKVFENKKIKREDVFITSKLWNTKHSKNDVRKACEQTMADLNLE